MLVIRVAIALTCLTFLPSSLLAQTTSPAVFSGTVTDSETAKPLQGVNVFLDGSTSGSSTDTLGNYTFQTSLTGKQRLVFSLLGYRSISKTVDIGEGDSFTFDIQLESRPIELDEIKVVSSNEEWQQNYNFFEAEFIGKE